MESKTRASLKPNQLFLTSRLDSGMIDPNLIAISDISRWTNELIEVVKWQSLIWSGVVDSLFDILQWILSNDWFCLESVNKELFDSLDLNNKVNYIVAKLNYFKEKKINIIGDIMKKFRLYSSEKWVLYDMDNSSSKINIHTFTKSSRKKIALRRMKNFFAKEYDKLWLAEKWFNKKKYIFEQVRYLEKLLRNSWFNFVDYSDSIILLWWDIILDFFNEFIWWNENNFVDIDAEIQSLHEIHQIWFYAFFKRLWFSKNALRIVFSQDIIDIAEQFWIYNIWSVEETGLIEEDKNWWIDGTSNSIEWFRSIVHKNLDWFLSFSIFFQDLVIWNRLFWEDKLRAFYKDRLYWIYKIFVSKFDWEKAVLYNLYSFKLKKSLKNQPLKSSEQPKEDEEKNFQHLFEWDISDDDRYDEKVILRDLWKLMKFIVTDLNLRSTVYDRYTLSSIKTILGDIKYRWLFVANNGFESSNLIIIKNEESWEKRLRLALDANKLWQDEFIFLSTQISYYLRYWKFIDRRQLYTAIYDEYNALMLKDQNMFDISIFWPQYEKLVKDLIYPLSIEYFNKYWKLWTPKNLLIVWLQWTGKSQFLFNLLNQKQFILNNKTFHLNANVLSVNIVELIDMLWNVSSSIKLRLADIYENTWIPIILTIEDIETVVNEKWGESDIITEALTNFFDGMWSIPVTVVATTNHPVRLSPRLLRPWRLENIMPFLLPLPVHIRTSLIETHITKNWLEDYLPNGFLDKYLTKTNRFTSSHIAWFMRSIKLYLDYETEFNLQFVLRWDDIDRIYDKFPLWLNNLMEDQKYIVKWLESLESKDDKLKIWF